LYTFLYLQSAGSKKEDKKKKGKKDEKGRPQSAVEKKPQQQRKKPELVDIIIKDVETQQLQVCCLNFFRFRFFVKNNEHV
jgi:hypothetical protein